MGTSSSGGGPGDKTPLLPSWALPGGDGGGDDASGPDGDAAAGGDAGGDDGPEAPDGALDGNDAGDGGAGKGDAPDGATDAGADAGQPVPAAATPRANWAAAKRSLGSVASGGGGRAAIGRAGNAYVRARGGARNAARSATSARSATARLGGFLSDVATRGVGPALESLGLGRLVGRDAHTVFSAIVDALAPEGTDLEQSATREAIQQTLSGLFEEYVAPDGSVAALESMTPDAVRAAVEASVSASIFNRWLGDLERMLEEKAVSPAQAVRLERDVEIYVRDTVKLDLRGTDPLTMRWDGPAGQAFVDRIYEDAYSLLGSAT